MSLMEWLIEQKTIKNELNRIINFVDNTEHEEGLFAFKMLHKYSGL